MHKGTAHRRVTTDRARMARTGHAGAWRFPVAPEVTLHTSPHPAGGWLGKMSDRGRPPSSLGVAPPSPPPCGRGRHAGRRCADDPPRWGPGRRCPTTAMHAPRRGSSPQDTGFHGHLGSLHGGKEKRERHKGQRAGKWTEHQELMPATRTGLPGAAVDLGKTAWGTRECVGTLAVL